MCRSIEYDIVEYHNDKDNSIVVDAIKCAHVPRSTRRIPDYYGKTGLF